MSALPNNVTHVLAVDTGSHFAAALVETKSCTLKDVFYTKNAGFEQYDVAQLHAALGQMVQKADLMPDEVYLVVELPSHRFFGRGNSTPLLKAMWQGIRLMRTARDYFQNDGTEQVMYVRAEEWNEGRGDRSKRTTFELLFPDFKDLDYYQNKHGGRANAHERDAALLAEWVIQRTVKIGIPLAA